MSYVRRFRRLYRRARARLRGEPDLEGLVEIGLKLGKNVWAGRGVMLDPWHAWLIEIGDGTTIAPRAVILAHDASTKAPVNYTRVAPVVIGRRCFIGAGAIILPGVTVGDEAIIGAGAVVRRDVPARTVAVGNPAEIVGSVDDYQERHQRYLEVSPVYPRGWTFNTGIDGEKKQRMREDLAEHGVGYVP